MEGTAVIPAGVSGSPMSTQALVLLDQMIVQQRAKCLKIAHRINPRLTPEDLMNPFDWPEVGNHPEFLWEDGLLAGLQAAHAALSAQMRDAEQAGGGTK